MLGLKPPWVAVDADILRVIQRAANFFHRIAQHVMNCRDQSLTGWCIKTRRQTVVASTGTMQNFVSVNVADAGNAMLVEQQGF